MTFLSDKPHLDLVYISAQILRDLWESSLQVVW